MIHILKTLPMYYGPIADGSKTFEIRKNDRNFKVGDTLRLQEYKLSSNEFTGRECGRIVTYILTAEQFPGLAPGYCCMGLKPMAEAFVELPSVKTLAECIKTLAGNVRKEAGVQDRRRIDRYRDRVDFAQ